MKALRAARTPARAWSRPDYDLDIPDSAESLLERDRPRLVIHAAAWTDVDDAARDPATAMRRNGEATGALAAACAQRGIALVAVSTNEVFDGRRSDGRGYCEADPPSAANPYGASKLAGEEAARSAFGLTGHDEEWADGLWIVRTSWLYGPPGNDFPAKIVAARDRLPADQPLPVVADEIGCPTYAPDLASAILTLVGTGQAGLYHLANDGRVSRHDWAAKVLAECRPGASMTEIKSSEYVRPSTPPAWGVLDCAAAARLGVRLRPWADALEAYLPSLCVS